MKNTFTRVVSVSFLLTLVFIACTKPGDGFTATQTAEQFMTAMQYGDFKEAAKYSSKETADLLKFQGMNMSRPFENGFEIKREEVNGDYAKVFYTEEGKGEDFIKLRKEGTVWRVIMTKAELRPNSIYDDHDDDSDSDYDSRSLSEEEKEQMVEVGKKFLKALQDGDMEEAEYLSDNTTGYWLIEHGDEKEYRSRWKKGFTSNGKILMGRSGKILYKIPGESETYQLRMEYKLGNWEVSYNGPEEWDGLGNVLPEVAKQMEKATQEMAKQMGKAMEEVVKGIPH